MIFFLHFYFLSRFIGIKVFLLDIVFNIILILNMCPMFIVFEQKFNLSENRSGSNKTSDSSTDNCNHKSQYSCSNLSTGQLFSSLSLGQKSPKSHLLGFCNILESIGVHHISRDRRNNTSQNRGHSV
jgi:hypothetical protein